MKLQIMFKAAKKAGAVARWAQHKRHRGFCTVVSIKCPRCGAWVKPQDWDPKSSACDHCTDKSRHASDLYRPVAGRNAGVK